MGQRRGQTRVGGDEVGDVCAGEIRQTFGIKLRLIDLKMLVENLGLVVDYPVRRVRGPVEQELGQEGEIQRSPKVAVVDTLDPLAAMHTSWTWRLHTHEQDVTTNDAHQHIPRCL